MPEISSFLGIRITMYYDDHLPAHFHAEYQGHRVAVSIAEAEAISGGLPGRQLKLVLAWAVLRREELTADWERARAHQRLEAVAPIE